jgi:hypothetical protein
MQYAIAHTKGGNSHFLHLVNVDNLKLSSSYDGRRENLQAANYQIVSVSPTVISNNEIVTVSFISSDPNPLDWIGAYAPADVGITTTVPFLFACVQELHLVQMKL